MSTEKKTSRSVEFEGIVRTFRDISVAGGDLHTVDGLSDALKGLFDKPTGHRVRILVEGSDPDA